MPFGEGNFQFAIVGIGCRMPGGVTSPNEFWEVLRNGKDCIIEVPDDRWSLEKFHDEDQTKPGKIVSRKCGFIDGIDKFDNTFFKTSPKEAASMDPQQRVLMEVTHEAFEDAGIIPDEMKESCGVYVGIGLMDYGVQILDCHGSTVNAYTLTGAAHSVAANRISYAFNLKGPSYAVDTACASSMTALHLACNSLLSNECEVAVVAGANALIIPDTTAGFSALGVLSPEGKCCPFSDSAKGYVRSEGWGAMIIKPLERAIADNDNIYATVIGSTIGANGHSQSLTMPSSSAQQETIEDTYKRFGVNMADVEYLEAHGTGTPVGDPIEAEAIGKAFSPHRSKVLKIGSVKSNFGHSECAAGAVATIKAALMLHRGYLVPSINYENPNPNINLEELKLDVQTTVEPLPTRNNTLVAINSFGFAGALAHAILQKPPRREYKDIVDPVHWSFGSSAKEGRSMILPLSAKSSSSLKDLALKWKSFEYEEDALRVIGWQATHRKHHECRLAILTNAGMDVRNKLDCYLENGSGEGVLTGSVYNPNHKVCFVFPGQGQQWAQMGKQLYKTEPIFRNTIEKCDEIFKNLSGWSLVHDKFLFNAHPKGKELTNNDINDMEISQPAILFLQIGLYELWRHWGLEPDVVVGHSLGEVAAAYASGGLTLEESVKVIYYRSKNQVLLKGTGSMVAVRLTVDAAQKLCNKYDNLYIAAENAPGSLTLAGSEENVQCIVNDNDIKAKQLRVQCAFHTPHMDPMEKPFRLSMNGAVSTPAGTRSVPVYSTLTGGLYNGDFNTDYWWQNIRNGVKFQPAIEGILRDIDANVFIECSASSTLISSVKQIAKDQGKTDLITVSSGQRDKDDRTSFLSSLATLYTNGLEINWKNVTNDAADWVDIPKYQWQHGSFWCEGDEKYKRRLGLDDRTFRGESGRLTFGLFPFLADHVVQDKVIFPGAGYIEYALQSFVPENKCPSLSNIEFKRVCVWPEETNNINDQASILLKCVKEGTGIDISSNDTINCSCNISSKNLKQATKLDIEVIQARCHDRPTKEAFYHKMASVGLNYGPAFQVVTEAMIGDGEIIGRLIPAKDTHQRIQTTQLDGCFQLLLNTIGETTTLYLPVEIDHLQMYVPNIPISENLIAYAKVTDCDSNMLVGDVTLSTDDGEILVYLSGVKCQNVTGTQSNVDIDDCFYETVWQPSSSCMGDTSILTDVFTEKFLSERYPEELVSVERVQKLLPLVKGVCASYIRHGISTTNRSTYKVHPLYVKRLEKICSDNTVVDVPFENIHKTIDYLNKEVPELYSELRMIRDLGDNFPKTLSDPGSAVRILFRQECLPIYFMDSVSTRLYYKLGTEIIERTVRKALEKKQVVRVLEIGGRMGGLAKYILEPLKTLGEERRLEYIFTDVSVTFFKHAEGILTDYPFIKYQQFDVEKDLATQGFVPGSVDLIVCMDTIHSLVNVNDSLRRVKDLLVDDGLFLMYEATNTHYIAELVFGCLDLCWVFEDFRKDIGRCWLSRDGWTNAMIKNGFVDVVAESTSEEFFHSVFLGRKPCDGPVNNAAKQYMIVSDGQQNEFVNCLQTLLRHVMVKNYNNVHDNKILDMSNNSEVEVIFICNESSDAFHALFKLLQIDDNNRVAFYKVWVLTSGSNMVSQNIEGSQAIGLVRALTNQSNTLLFSVDIDHDGSPATQAKLMVEYMTSKNQSEREVAIRNDTYYYPRIRKLSSERSLLDTPYWQLTQYSNSTLYSFDDLGIAYTSDMLPPPGKVVVQTKSAALNFKDVMMALGMLDRLIGSSEKKFGLELSGIVHSVGEGVTTLKRGDEVFGFGDHCLASHSICDAELLVKKPSNLSWDECSGMGIIFATSYHSLIERANLQAGETVLIHSACGGVGLSAIQVARMVGANIICTAGTNQKRQYLKSLGIQHVSDSRTDAFYSDVMKWTNGRGVDVVLNSLSGDLLKKGVECLAPGGRFCEIGKRDILQNSSLQMHILLENKTFISSQIDIMIELDKSRAHRLLKKVASLFENEILKPIQFAVSSIVDYQDVFARTAKGSHIGKVIFNIPDNFQPPKVNPTTKLFKQNATYIITGGFGGIGLAMSRWLANKGAKHISLISRRGCCNSAGRRTLEYLKRKGVTVYAYAMDLSKKENIQVMIDQLRKDNAPDIKGIFHLAGYIIEETFNTLTTKEVNNIISSKATSAQYMSDLTTNMGLDIFFTLSSVTTMCGNSSQSMYIAANNFLDALAMKRRSQGLPSLSIQLSPVKGAGYLEDKSDVTKALNMRGHLSLHVEEFLQTLSTLLQSQDTPPVFYLANQDWNATQMFTYEENLKFYHLVSGQQANKTDCSLSLEDVEKSVKLKMSKMLCVEPDTIDVNQPMINYGVDSLMAVEMVTWASKELNVVVSQLDILGGITTKVLLEKALDNEMVLPLNS
ncbi:phthiocerol synthesis polyketide synthase type I PpsC-like [Anneissia japonica]|uniref:phthiocerol synthesis polyketide synthase type I PpsC-like n=1 Tax=Anneissia japonica TaxID=1529436 RepID=UPI00142569D5|nr:phthiocerol synthesis polyketide synthase type I PpsC-like [Anneissia japonica]